MRLTYHTDYAFRLLMWLAMAPDDERVTIDDVVSRYHVSRNHLVKVSQTLVHAGFVEGVRGRGGGLRLARPATEISLGAVVRATEEGLELVECFDAAKNRCVLSPACTLRGVLDDAVAAFLAVLDRHTLADLVAKPAALRSMRSLLGLRRASA